ncbi:hypothetical protein RQP46_010883 [Phenoliferia psychrophenolica]
MASINSLPPEILSDILTLVVARPAKRFYRMTDPRTEYYPLLRTLCLVSRLFKAIAQARLFRHIIIEDSRSMSIVRGRVSRATLLSTLLLSSPAFGQHPVKTLCLKHVYQDTATTIIQRCGALGLQSLSLDNMELDARVVLSAGPDLKDLEIIECDSEIQEAQPTSGWIIPFELERLSLRTECPQPSLIHALITSSPNLRELDIPHIVAVPDVTPRHRFLDRSSALAAAPATVAAGDPFHGLAPAALETLASQITSLGISVGLIDEFLPTLSLFVNLKHLTFAPKASWNAFGPGVRLLPRISRILGALTASTGSTGTSKLEKITLMISFAKLLRSESNLMKVLESDVLRNLKVLSLPCIQESDGGLLDEFFYRDRCFIRSSRKFVRVLWSGDVAVPSFYAT